MAKSTLNGISRTELALEPSPISFECSDAVQQSLSRSMGFDSINSLWRTSPVVNTTNGIPFGSNIVPVGNIPLGRISNKYYELKAPTTYNTVSTTNLANNGTVDVWTATVGFLIWMFIINITGSNAGFYSIIIAGVEVWRARINVNTTTAFSFPQTPLSVPTGTQLLQVKNLSGAQSDVTVAVLGLEVTP